MKIVATVASILVLAGTAAAFDLGNHQPTKAPAQHAQNVPIDRQGGDTILDATLVTVPVSNLVGTTSGYSDDYDEVCPYSTSTSPDVVYTFVPSSNTALDIDMFGSAYDTKIYVYDENLALIACNDDFYSDYTSFLENVPVAAGVQYFLVIDGYGGDFGDYLLNITEFQPCVLECPAGGWLEGEPPLTNDYVDWYNGGCNYDTVNPSFQYLNWGVFCGVSGFYLASGGNSRDTDWFIMTIPGTGILEVTGDAELATYMFELGPQDCNSVGVLQNVQIGPCTPGTMVMTGTPGTEVWFWVGPTTFASPDGSDVYEYDYTLVWFGDGCAVEDQSWTNVKALFE